MKLASRKPTNKQFLRDLNPTGEMLSPPELQLVCAALFDNLDPPESVITASAYAELGAAPGILRGHLHRVLQQNMNAPEREIAHRILESLVTSDNHRALRTLPELVKNTQTDEETLIKVLQLMVDNRLIRVSEDKTTDVGGAYELAHDYLLTEMEVDPETQACKAAQELLARDVAWSPDGHTLATAGGDKAIRLWDTQTGTQRLTLIGHEDDVLGVDFNPDGTKLTSSSADQSIMLWDVSTEFTLSKAEGLDPGLLRIFHTDFKKILALARAYKRRELTKAEREQFIGESVFGETGRL
jgi:hypothetical protein